MEPVAIADFCAYLHRRNYAPHTIDNDGRDLRLFFGLTDKDPCTVSGRDVVQFIEHQRQGQRTATTIKRIGKLNGIFAPVSAGAPRCPATCACRSARWRGAGGVSRVLRGRGSGHGRGWQAGEGGWHMGVPRLSTHVADGTTPRVMDLVERDSLLATTGRGNGRWDGGELEMT